MQLPDVNILVNAFRKETEQHERCRDWLDRSCVGPAQFAISHLTLASVIRIVSNKKIFKDVSAVPDAIQFANRILAHPNCVRLEPGPNHWRLYSELLVETGIAGPQTTDVWFAALAMEWGCQWVTLDGGFARYPRLNWCEP